MQTKSDKVREMLKDGQFKEALAIVKTFKLGLSKQQRELLSRAHESQWNPAFYIKLGHNPEALFNQATELMLQIYGDK